MMGPRQVDQAALFYEFSLERHVPAGHLLRSIGRFVDLSEVRGHADTHLGCDLLVHDARGYQTHDLLLGRKIQLPVGSSDAALAPYHVDRSKLFVIERLDDVEEVDAARIARAIEYTRFPYLDTPNGEVDDLNEEEGLLLRAADLIGQLGDPNYIRKSNALFYEFEEVGLNKTLGYATPADIVYEFPQFYWTNVAPQIQLAIRYLNVTSSGRQWIANLHSNVFRAEREVNLTGPQR